jgi:hypothetical protein
MVLGGYQRRKMFAVSGNEITVSLFSAQNAFRRNSPFRETAKQAKRPLLFRILPKHLIKNPMREVAADQS